MDDMRVRGEKRVRRRLRLEKSGGEPEVETGGGVRRVSRWNGNRWAEIWSGTPDKQVRLNYGKFLISLKKLRLITIQN
jgi:hypothetical protein